MTARSERSAKSAGVEALIGQDGEMLRRLMQEALQQVTGSGDDRGGGRRPRRADSGAAYHPREVVEAALAHVVQNRVEAAYVRSDLFERRQQFMDDWAAYLANGSRPESPPRDVA